MILKSSLTLIMTAGAIVAFIGPSRTSNADGEQSARIAATLDAFHAAASKADFETYFAILAPDGVFLGTDATERWTVDEFKAYAKPFFDKGQGWTYTSIADKRFITIANDAKTAWFDELLANEKYGTCRGSGVLRKMGNDWRIAQYNLAFMIPNDAAKDVVALIKTKHE